jgi:drug/metabolite transporter (DMT)-like permease
MPTIDAVPCPPEPRRSLSVARAILCALGATFLFSILDASVKFLAGRDYPTGELVFFRSFLGMLPATWMIVQSRNWSLFTTTRPMSHLVRSLVGLVSVVLFFYCLGPMKLGDVVAISFSAPLFVTALSVPILGEHVGPHRWGAVAVGFIGVLLMVKPSADLLSHPDALLALLSSLAYALAILQIRKLSATEPSLTIVVYFSGFVALMAAITLPFAFKLPDTGLDCALLLILGLAGGGAQILMTTAYRHAAAAVISPFDYTMMVWATGFGFVLFGELPGLDIVAGALIVTASGLYILYRETRREKACQPASALPKNS